MKYYFQRNTIEIQQINADFNDGKLYADRSYQRRRVWNEQDKVRLIETILLDLVMPEVFFWTAERDAETGKASTHIVDGQQRITAIVEYINGDYALTIKHLLNEVIKNECGGKKFSELDSAYKNKLWEYPISVVQIDSACNKLDIKEMFYRLNLTNYNLNSQERRNSIDSAFGDKSEALSNYDFWKKARVFSSNDAKRMLDVEYCCSIYILANEGIVDQTSGTKINNYYDDYKSVFDSDHALENRIMDAIEVIDNLIDKSTLSFISKKAQLYTLFSVIFRMRDVGDSFDDFFEKMKAFISVYSKFRNEFNMEYSDTKYAAVYEEIKKYKLASSEGINKISNRMIRYEILYKYITRSDKDVYRIFDAIGQDLSRELETLKNKKDGLEEDDLVDEEG